MRARAPSIGDSSRPTSRGRRSGCGTRSGTRGAARATRNHANVPRTGRRAGDHHRDASHRGHRAPMEDSGKRARRTTFQTADNRPRDVVLPGVGSPRARPAGNTWPPCPPRHGEIAESRRPPDDPALEVAVDLDAARKQASANGRRSARRLGRRAGRPDERVCLRSSPGSRCTRYASASAHVSPRRSSTPRDSSVSRA